MRHSDKHLGWGRSWLVLLGIAVVAVAVTAGTAQRGDAGTAASTEDIGAISQVIGGYAADFAGCFCVPSDALATVQERMARLSHDADWRAVDESESRDSVLPDAARSDLNLRWKASLSRYCTERYSVAQSGVDWAQMIDTGLYNNPAGAVLVEEPTKVLAVQCKQLQESDCVAWALLWSGDVTTAGKGVQSWSVHEYRLAKVGGEWRIDGDSNLGVMCTLTDASGNARFDQWGPYAPHDSVTQIESGQQSVLYPGEAVPLSELTDLEALAAK